MKRWISTGEFSNPVWLERNLRVMYQLVQNGRLPYRELSGELSRNGAPEMLCRFSAC